MRAGKRSFHQMLCRRLIDYAVPEGPLVVATPQLSQLCLTNTIVQIAVVTVTNGAAPVIQLPWTSSLMASCRSLMCEALPSQNVHTLTRDTALATATEARWTTCLRYPPAVMDIRHRTPLTHLALHIATLHARYHLPIRTHNHRPRAHTHRLHTNLLWHLPPSRRSLQAS
jgi:hypothetical protein